MIGSACQPSGAGRLPPSGNAVDTTAQGVVSSQPPPVASAARLRITPATDSRHARPDSGISVTVTHGRITGVTVRGGGHPVPGHLEPHATAWHSRWALTTATRYTVRATAVDAAGRSVSATSSFRTLTPSRTFATMIYEGFHKTYGVGMPVILRFSEPITDRDAVERSLELRTSKPVVGAWYWDGDETLYFRPRSYWPPHTTVSFVGHLDGVQGAQGMYGVHTLTQTFHIGRSLIAVASTRRHHVRVYLDRKLLGNWPISTGRAGDDTPDGTYLTITKSNPEEMIGPDYDIQVPWSVRFTYSGDFLHDAFWSVGQQGFENVSHGCVNLSPANAKTYYQLAVPGDPVTIVGSPRGGVWGNGWTVWFLSWRELLKGSALHEAVRAGPKSSSFVDPAGLPPSRSRPPLGGSRPGNAVPPSTVRK